MSSLSDKSLNISPISSQRILLPSSTTFKCVFVAELRTAVVLTVSGLYHSSDIEEDFNSTKSSSPSVFTFFFFFLLTTSVTSSSASESSEFFLFLGFLTLLTVTSTSSSKFVGYPPSFSSSSWIFSSGRSSPSVKDIFLFRGSGSSKDSPLGISYASNTLAMISLANGFILDGLPSDFPNPPLNLVGD
jgi:hypothetical protein